METWKDINGYEGIYQISSHGNVMSLGNNFNRKNKLLKPGKNPNGYLFVVLCTNSNPKNYRIHQLVANHFVDNLLRKPQVNHINGIKIDNNYLNLEWVTNIENVNHAFDNELNPICKKVIDLSSGFIYRSITSASIGKNIKYGTLYGMLSGRVPNKTTLRYL